MMVITSDRHKEEDRLRWWVSSNCLCHKGSKSKQKSSMSQKMGRMSMKRTPYRSRDEVLVNYILQLGVLFSISCVELTLILLLFVFKLESKSFVFHFFLLHFSYSMS